ncbi:hypothetical protein [Gracilimonas halophila]|uniref:Uncharacterized protein n=1 Tax=Gracilimonas halophila TaxID=1834464 RepID=A0ABW5JKZ3_9BACT
MKSFFIWLIAVIIGGMSGFGVSYLIGYNMYLAVGLGIIFGSTTGVTINIHRDRDIQLPDNELSNEKDPGGKSSGKVSQKAS